MPQIIDSETGRSVLRAFLKERSLLTPMRILFERLGNFCQIPMASFHPFVVGGPEANRKVLVTERNKFLWRSTDPVTDLLHRGVLVTDGEEHDLYRGLAVLALVWAVALGYLISGWPPATYLAITLVWALPPIGLQLIFGADILWRHIRLVLLTIIPMTIYLSAADSLAITSGTWTIDPQQSTGILMGSLPIEEAVFFLITNILIGFGITLLLANESEIRLEKIRAKFSRT